MNIKSIFLLILTFVFLSGCSEPKEVYTIEEVEYLEAMSEAVKSLTLFYDDYSVTLIKLTENDSADGLGEDLAKGVFAIGYIEEILKNKLTPPNRFEETHNKLLEAANLLKEATVSLPFRIQSKQSVSEDLKKVEDASVLLDEISVDVLKPFEKSTKDN